MIKIKTKQQTKQEKLKLISSFIDKKLIKIHAKCRQRQRLIQQPTSIIWLVC